MRAWPQQCYRSTEAPLESWIVIIAHRLKRMLAGRKVPTHYALFTCHMQHAIVNTTQTISTSFRLFAHRFASPTNNRSAPSAEHAVQNLFSITSEARRFSPIPSIGHSKRYKFVTESGLVVLLLFSAFKRMWFGMHSMFFGCVITEQPAIRQLANRKATCRHTTPSATGYSPPKNCTLRTMRNARM